MSINLQIPLKLRPKIQNYAWGKRGASSLVARLLSSAINENEPYAELWMGSHPNGCAEVELSHSDHASIPLSSILSQYPLEVLGKRVNAKFSGQMPFLLKILSVDKPLSIQAHPDAKLATALHQRDPLHYPDSNPKPELSIALSELHILYGFKSIEKIRSLLERTPEMQTALGEELTALVMTTPPETSSRIIIKRIYTKLITGVAPEILTACNTRLFQRLQTSAQDDSEHLIIKICKAMGGIEQTAADIGLMSSLLLNYVTLNAGEGIFIAPNTLHAHLEGDLLECMANSDNVVRAGLTKKYQDTSTLIEMLDYSCELPHIVKALPDSNDAQVMRYSTVAEEFTIDEFRAIPEQATYDDNSGPVLLFCLSGTAIIKTEEIDIKLHTGESCLIPACLKSYTVHYKGAQLFRARVP